MLARFNMPRTAAVVSGAMATLIIAAPLAAAQNEPVVVQAQPGEVRTERVSYRDLNLAERKDLRRLRLRVAGAVKRVCLFETGRPGIQSVGYHLCKDGASGGATPQIAQAVARAREIAMTGKSSIAATVITIKAPAS